MSWVSLGHAITDLSICRDIMGNPYGFDNSGNPGFLSVWSREKIQWMVPTEIIQDGIYALKPAETSAEAYKININPFGFFPEYLLIENRQQISFDETLFGNGLMIYHIDDGADGMNQRGYPGQDGGYRFLIRMAIR